MSVRLYGRDVGNGSLAAVTRGFRQVLEGAGLLEGFYALDRSGGDEEEDAPAGAQARDGVFTGNLNLVNHMTMGAKHERHWVQVTPNSTHIPRNLLEAIVSLPNPRIMSASKWGTRVILDALSEMGFGYETVMSSSSASIWSMRRRDTTVEVYPAPHGISSFAPQRDVLEKTRADYGRGEFRVVHFSTTEGQRKGTLELLQAWRLLCDQSKLPAAAELSLVLDHHARAALGVRMMDISMRMPTGVRILPRGDMDSVAMSGFLCQQHLVAAPSRGEGFGLLVLQARACGVPVVATGLTGHSAGHCRGPGALRILQNPTPVPIDDGVGALAPAVEPREIADSIHYAHHAWVGLSHICEVHAPSVAQAWSWENSLSTITGSLR